MSMFVLAGMSPPAMTREQKSARYHVFRLKKKAQESIRCIRCKGKGKAVVRVTSPARSGGVYIEDVWKRCPRCGGARICPSKGFHAAMADYCRKKRQYEKRYLLFGGRLATGFEPWLFQKVKTDRAVQLLNLDAWQRLSSGKAKIDDVFFVAVQVFNITERNGAPIVQAWLKPEKGFERDMNLIIVFDKLPDGLTDSSRLLLLAYNQGETEYMNFFDKKLEARVLTAMEVRKITGRKLYWQW